MLMNNDNSKIYAFVLGRERDLCLAELKAVLRSFCFDFVILSLSKNIVFIKLAGIDDSSVSNLADMLGGTIKVFRIIGNTGNIKRTAVDYIEKNFQGGSKISFAFSAYLVNTHFSTQKLNAFGFQIKNELKRVSVSTRYIELRDGIETQTILSLKEKLVHKGVEFGIFPNNIGVLVGLSNPEEWSSRDYDKPAGDKRSGMLPPKLARIMVNLALGQFNQRSVDSGQMDKDQKPGDCRLPADSYLVVDPFCGSGNILLESLVLGHDIYGSDSSEKAIRDSHANIEWLMEQMSNSKTENIILQADATKVDFLDLFNSHHLPIDSYAGFAVVTEPYLGEPKRFEPSMNSAKGEYDKIGEIYLTFLENIKQLASNNKQMVLCLVFPLVETFDKGQFSLFADIVDEIKKIGYTTLQSPLIYGRDYQVVKREIVLLGVESKV